MLKKYLKINKRNINLTIACALLLSCVILLVLVYTGLNPVDKWYRGIVWCDVALLVIYIILNYCADKIAQKVLKYRIAENCPYLLLKDCPFADEKKCEYDKSTCLAIQRKKKRNTTQTFVYILFVFALIVILGGIIHKSFVVKEDVNWLNVLFEFSIPINISIIAAILVSWIIDIPSRIMEEKSFFVEVLTSNEYLTKSLDEDKLTDLRLRAIRNMHNRDYPKMAEGLIEVDRKISEMLKTPYFSKYYQSLYVSMSKDVQDSFVKKVKVAFTAQNPYGSRKSIRMDIGKGNYLSFERVSEENAKKLFKLIKLNISFDGEDKKWDIRNFVRLGYKGSKIEGLPYNGIVMITAKENNIPISYERIKDNKVTTTETSVSYEQINEWEKGYLEVEFDDEIYVEYEYEVTIPIQDNVFTKRLKYPAKNFHLDYALADEITDISLVGQLIGTIIDQNDVVISTQPNKKQITMNTHDWLLPKNGAVVVHCNIKNGKEKKEK